MTDRTIILGENGRASYRGVKQLGDQSWLAYQRTNDDWSYVIDYAGWLGSDTIASVTRSAFGTAYASTSNTTTTTTQALSGHGYVDIQITTAAGRDRVDRICIEPHAEDYPRYPSDYGR